MRAGFVIFLYSLLFTSLVSFFAYAIIPDGGRSQYFDNLISGIAINLVGPMTLKLLFQAFIVIVGFLMIQQSRRNTLPPTSRFWLECAERQLATHLWQSESLPQDGRLNLSELTADDLLLARYWRD